MLSMTSFFISCGSFLSSSSSFKGIFLLLFLFPSIISSGERGKEEEETFAKINHFSFLLSLPFSQEERNSARESFFGKRRRGRNGHNHGLTHREEGIRLHQFGACEMWRREEGRMGGNG